jgi:tricorn protease
MQGELGTSHAYEMGGDHRRPPSIALGYLGADVELAADGASYTITRIVRGDAWDAAPIRRSTPWASKRKVGERILAINGQPVSRERPPQALLVHQAARRWSSRCAGRRRDTTRTCSSRRSPTKCRRAIANGSSATGAGCTSSRADASATSTSRHDVGGLRRVPSLFQHRVRPRRADRRLSATTAAATCRSCCSKRSRAAHRLRAVALERSTPYPDEAVAGPVVALTNEHAGSDGDIFSHGFKLMGIGPLVGTRTGAASSASGRGTRSSTAPRRRSRSSRSGSAMWAGASRTTAPTRRSKSTIAPHDSAANKDRQLATALATALELVEKSGPSKPEFGPRPDLAPPRFPK